MRAILVFDQLNDLIYSKYDRRFVKHLRKLAKTQGLLQEGKADDDVNSNVIIQIFSPIVASQRIMSCQFGNSYSSIQCENDINFMFDEYMGYLFIFISQLTTVFARRTLGVFLAIVKHVCGPDVSLLKCSPYCSSLVSRLHEAWTHLYKSDQAMLFEAMEQLLVNADISSATMKALHEAVDRLKDFPRVHALVLVENKFLSLYSSRSALELSPADIMFLMLLCEADHSLPSTNIVADSTGSDSSDEFYSPQGSPESSPMLPRKCSPLDLSTEQEQHEVHSQMVLLMGKSNAYSPHIIHYSAVEDGVYLLLIIETGNPIVSSGLYEALHSLNALQGLQLQKDIEGMKHSFEVLDSSMKKIFDGLKKTKNIKAEVESCQKKLYSKWEFMRKKYVECMKSPEMEGIIRIESITGAFMDGLKDLMQLVWWDPVWLVQGRDTIHATVEMVKHKLSDFSNFLRVKALRNFTLGSRASLTINKYLEEFPGLVHFVYIDRSNHRLTAPSLDFSSKETLDLTIRKIWTMVDFSRVYLENGKLSVMWKDVTFNYAYFLWFEDTSGSPLKPKVSPHTISTLNGFPIPGMLCGDFYKKLTEICFPKMPANKVRCYELYCIHLGLATASCVLEHSRRLAATIWDVTGLPNNPADLL